MRNYFESIESIHQFTMELNYHHNIKCKHCLKTGELISHGFVYKKQNVGKKITVGKRIFCSNRHGRTGCGKTTRLYLAIDIPTLQYSTSHLFIFIVALLSMASIQKAYKIATNTDDPRNAYRWLHRLWKKLIEYRCFLQVRTEYLNNKFKSRRERLQILLPTLQRLFLEIGESPCTRYQQLSQTSFI